MNPRLCKSHESALRKTIESRGLGVLIADTPEDVERCLASQHEDGRTIDNFEPMAGATNAIIVNAYSAVGSMLLVPNFDGSPRCPICYLNDVDPLGLTYDHWLDKAADDMVKIWKSFAI